VEQDPTPRILNDWLGERVLIEYLTGPDIDLEDLDRMVGGHLQARTELLYLEQVGSYGIAVKKVEEGKLEFIGWGRC
jgi:hypothetical protein